MSVCTFFGHRDCPNTVKPKLRHVLVNLIEHHAVDLFYVGKQGRFDAIVYALLKELQNTYPQIRYAVVLERMPQNHSKSDFSDPSDTLLPEGAEAVHPRFALSWRNNWMLKQSDYVVTYITRPQDGAAQFAQKAKRQHKSVINLT